MICIGCATDKSDQSSIDTFTTPSPREFAAGMLLEQPALVPNPANRNVVVTFDMSTSSAVEIRLTDLSGRLLQTVNIEAASGINEISLKLDDIESGLYMVEVITPVDRQVMRLVRMD
jgi:hypothetical protein